MQRVACIFVDCVNGREVNEYQDRLGRLWMAQSPWAWFRLRLFREGS